MELILTERSAETKRTGEQDDIVATAAESVKIEIGGEQILDADVPAGKVWTVAISVSIDETDA